MPHHGLQKELVSATAHFMRLKGLVNAVPLYSFLAQHSQLLSLFRVVLMVTAQKTASGYQNQLDVPWSPNMLKQIYIRQGIPLMTAEIRWLNGRVRESKSRLVVTFLPPQWWTHKDPSELWKSDLIETGLADLCASDGIPFIDLTPQVRAREASLGKSLYYQGRDAHPNPTGYEAFGEIIADYLLSQGLVPADTRAER